MAKTAHGVARYQQMQTPIDHTAAILVDSDAFVGLFYEKDAHHQEATALFADLEAKSRSIVVTSFVITETATVLSHRKDQTVARAFLKWVETVPTIYITEELQREALDFFKKQTLKGTSVIDCANAVVMTRFHIPQILGFDGIYTKKWGLQRAG